MVEEIGGPSVPAIGFALGLERILLAQGEQAAASEPCCFVAPIGARALDAGLVLARELRTRDVRVDLDGRGGSLKSMLRRANAVGARFCVIIGDSELDRGVVKVKDLAAHGETEEPLAGAAERIAGRLAAAPSKDEASR